MSSFRRKWAASEYHDGSLEEHLLARQDMHLEKISDELQRQNGSSYAKYSQPTGNYPGFRVTLCYLFSIFFLFTAMTIALGLPNAIVMTATPIFWAPAVVVGAGFDKLTDWF